MKSSQFTWLEKWFIRNRFRKNPKTFLSSGQEFQYSGHPSDGWIGTISFAPVGRSICVKFASNDKTGPTPENLGQFKLLSQKYLSLLPQVLDRLKMDFKENPEFLNVPLPLRGATRIPEFALEMISIGNIWQHPEADVSLGFYSVRTEDRIAYYVFLKDQAIVGCELWD